MPDQFNIPEIPELPDSCPISDLIDKRITQMNDEELAKHVISLRAAVESPQNLRKLLTRKGSVKKETRSVAPDLGLLGL